MDEFLEQHPTAKSLFESVNLNPNSVELNINRYNTLIDELADLILDGNLEGDNIAKFITAFGKYQDLDIDEYIKNVETAFKNDR
ncbi:MAG: hypothetical protein ACRC4Q_07870 [Paraclostridium dentum]